MSLSSFPPARNLNQGPQHLVSKCSSIELYPISAARSFKIDFWGLRNSFEKHGPSNHTCSVIFFRPKKKKRKLPQEVSSSGGWALRCCVQQGHLELSNGIGGFFTSELLPEILWLVNDKWSYATIQELFPDRMGGLGAIIISYNL